jgi:hypothetical protein
MPARRLHRNVANNFRGGTLQAVGLGVFSDLRGGNFLGTKDGHLDAVQSGCLDPRQEKKCDGSNPIVQICVVTPNFTFVAS